MITLITTHRKYKLVNFVSENFFLSLRRSVFRQFHYLARKMEKELSRILSLDLLTYKLPASENLVSNSESKKYFHLPYFSGSRYFLTQVDLSALLIDCKSIIFRPPSAISTFRSIKSTQSWRKTHRQQFRSWQVRVRSAVFAVNSNMAAIIKIRMRETLRYQQLHDFSSVMLYNTTRKRENIQEDVYAERLIYRRKL